MELLTPGIGLIFWQVIVFLLLLLVLSKYAWKPIMSSLRERETTIQDALDAVEQAKKEAALLQSDNERLLKEVSEERDSVLREARHVAAQIHEESQKEAEQNATRMIEDARAQINAEKEAALKDVKNHLSDLSLEIASKLVRRNLSTDAKQRQLVNDLVNELN